jgi:hypothetical protein
MGMADHPRQALGLIACQPTVDGVGVACFQQPLPGYPIRRLALSDLQQGGTTFPHVGTRVVVPMHQQLLALYPSQAQRPLRRHLALLCARGPMASANHYRF